MVFPYTLMVVNICKVDLYYIHGACVFLWAKVVVILISHNTQTPIMLVHVSFSINFS